MPPSPSSSSSSPSSSVRVVSKLLTSALILRQPSSTDASIFDYIGVPPPGLIPPPGIIETNTTVSTDMEMIATPGPTSGSQESHTSPSSDVGLVATPSPTTGSQGAQWSEGGMTPAPAAIPAFDFATTTAPMATAMPPPGVQDASPTSTDTSDAAEALSPDAADLESTSSPYGGMEQPGGRRRGERRTQEPEKMDPGYAFTSSPTSSPGMEPGSWADLWSTMPTMAPTSSPSGMSTSSPSGVSGDLLQMTAGPSSMNIDDTTTRDSTSGGFSPIKNAAIPWKTLPFCVAAAAAVTGIATVFSSVA